MFLVIDNYGRVRGRSNVLEQNLSQDWECVPVAEYGLNNCSHMTVGQYADWLASLPWY